MSKTLRPYQSDAIKAVEDKLSKGVNTLLLVLATGLGKTVTAVKTADKFKSTLFVVDSEELLEQAALAFLRERFDDSLIEHIQKIGFVNYVREGGLFAATDYKVGLIKADVFQPYGNVVFCSAQTLHRRLDKLPKDLYDLIIVDEAHCFMAASYFRGITHFTPRLRLGLTATPQRLDNLPLSDLFSEIAYEYNIDAGIKDGYLVELNAIRIKTNCSLDSVKTLGGEFNQKDLSNEINTPARNNQIADSYLKYCSGRKALGFGIDISHCLDMAEAFKQKGINAEAISSDESRTGDRDAQWKAYQQNKIDVLFNVGLLTKGVDSPETSCIITSRPTKSISLYMQIIGRGTRTLPGVINGFNSPEERILAINKSAKKDCIILDIVDSTTRHSLINAWELDKQKPIEDRTFVNKENKDKLLLDRISRSVKLQHTRNSDEKVNLLSLPKLKISTSYKMEEDATMAQLAAIERWNYPMDVHYTKSMIVEIFGKQPATAKHISFLKWKGYDVSGFVSVAEATAASREIAAREEKLEREKNQNNIKNNLPFKF